MEINILFTAFQLRRYPPKLILAKHLLCVSFGLQAKYCLIAGFKEFTDGFHHGQKCSLAKESTTAHPSIGLCRRRATVFINFHVGCKFQPKSTSFGPPDARPTSSAFGPQPSAQPAAGFQTAKQRAAQLRSNAETLARTCADYFGRSSPRPSGRQLRPMMSRRPVYEHNVLRSAASSTTSGGLRPQHAASATTNPRAWLRSVAEMQSAGPQQTPAQQGGTSAHHASELRYIMHE